MSGHFPFQHDNFSLVPAAMGNETAAPFISLILVTLGYDPLCGLSIEPPVREYFQENPDLYPVVRALGERPDLLNPWIPGTT
jgi:hypothetical protein